MIMINKLKLMNNNIIVNNPDSDEDVEEVSCFPKGSAFAAFFSNVFNYADVECMHEQEHG